MFCTFSSITVFLQCFPFVASFVTAFSLPSLSFKNYPFTFLLFVSQIMSTTIPGQVGGLTALNILHSIFVCSKALMQSLPLLLLQWIFHTVCQWFLWLAPLNFWPWIPSIVHNFESILLGEVEPPSSLPLHTGQGKVILKFSFSQFISKRCQKALTFFPPS